MCRGNVPTALLVNSWLRGWRQRAGAEGPPDVLPVPTRHGRTNPVALAAIPLIRARADEVAHRAEQWPKAARPSRSEGTMTEAVLGRSWHEPAACPQQWRESGTAPPRTWPTATPVRAHANASSDSAKLSLFCGGEGDGAEVHWNWLCGRVLCAEKESISAKAPLGVLGPIRLTFCGSAARWPYRCLTARRNASRQKSTDAAGAPRRLLPPVGRVPTTVLGSHLGGMDFGILPADLLLTLGATNVAKAPRQDR